jgi:hypothetical protein
MSKMAPTFFDRFTPISLFGLLSLSPAFRWRLPLEGAEDPDNFLQMRIRETLPAFYFVQGGFCTRSTSGFNGHFPLQKSMISNCWGVANRVQRAGWRAAPFQK